MDVNVKGVFFTVQAVLPLMREGGSIVLNTSSLNQMGALGRTILSASKAAVRSFARTMSDTADLRFRDHSFIKRLRGRWGQNTAYRLLPARDLG